MRNLVHLGLTWFHYLKIYWDIIHYLVVTQLSNEASCSIPWYESIHPEHMGTERDECHYNLSQTKILSVLSWGFHKVHYLLRAHAASVTNGNSSHFPWDTLHNSTSSLQKHWAFLTLLAILLVVAFSCPNGGCGCLQSSDSQSCIGATFIEYCYMLKITTKNTFISYINHRISSQEKYEHHSQWKSLYSCHNISHLTKNCSSEKGLSKEYWQVGRDWKAKSWNIPDRNCSVHVWSRYASEAWRKSACRGHNEEINSGSNPLATSAQARRDPNSMPQFLTILEIFHIR